MLLPILKAKSEATQNKGIKSAARKRRKQYLQQHLFAAVFNTFVVYKSRCSVKSSSAEARKQARNIAEEDTE